MALKPRSSNSAHGVHPQAVGDGGVDLEGFLGDAPAFFAGQHFQRAHVVQAVGQLDQDHANVAGHGHGHFLEVFRLRFGLGLEVHLGQLADPVDQFGHGFAELRLKASLAIPVSSITSCSMAAIRL
jgi:hypothetical protein